MDVGEETIEIDVPEGTGAEGEVPSADTTSSTAENKEGKAQPRERKDPEPCEKPDPEAYKQAQDKIRNELAEIQKKVDAITAKIDAACLTRQKFRDEVKNAQDQLTASTDQRKSNTELIDAARQQYSSIADARKQQRALLDPLKQGLKFSSRAALEDAIIKIESRLSSANLSPALRSKYMNDIALLKSQRIQTMRYEEQLTLVRLALVDPDPLREEREAKLVQNRALLAESDAAHAKRESAKEGANKWNKDVEDLIAQRRVVLQQKSEAQGRQNVLGKQFRDQERAYERYQNFLAFKAREAARAQRAAEKAERAAAAAARAAASGIPEEGEQTPENWSGDGVYKGKQAGATADKSKPAPVKRNNYDAQLNVIADLRRYLEFYKPKDVGRSADAPGQETPVAAQPRREFDEKKTVTLFKKKNEVEDEWGSVIGTSKPAKTPRGDAPKPKKAKDTPVNHIPDALAKFKFVDVDPPLLSSKIESVLKVLEEKKQYYETLPDKEAAEAEKKKESKESAPAPAATTGDNELEEGEIVDAEESDGQAAAPKEVSQTKAIAITQEVITSEAVENLVEAVAAATIKDVNEAVIHAGHTAEEEEEELTPEQAAAMAAMNDELGFVVDEAQAGLGDWVPPVAEKKPEHKDDKPAEPKAAEAPSKTSANETATAPKSEAADEEEEELTPEQAAAMAAMNEELGFVVDEAQAGLGDWVPPVAEKKPEHKDDKPAEPKAAEAPKAAEPKPNSKQTEPVEEPEEELTPEQAAAMAAMNEELGLVVDEAQAGLGDWVPPVAEKKSEASAAIAEITKDAQDTVVAAVAKAVDAVASAPAPSATEEDEGEEGDEEEAAPAAATAVKPAAPTAVKPAAAPAPDAEEEEYEEIELEEGDEGEEGDEEVVR